MPGSGLPPSTLAAPSVQHSLETSVSTARSFGHTPATSRSASTVSSPGHELGVPGGRPDEHEHPGQAAPRGRRLKPRPRAGRPLGQPPPGHRAEHGGGQVSDDPDGSVGRQIDQQGRGEIEFNHDGTPLSSLPETIDYVKGTESRAFLCIRRCPRAPRATLCPASAPVHHDLSDAISPAPKPPAPRHRPRRSGLPADSDKDVPHRNRGWRRHMAGRPSVLVFDVNETLSDMNPLRGRFGGRCAGPPPGYVVRRDVSGRVHPGRSGGVRGVRRGREGRAARGAVAGRRSASRRRRCGVVRPRGAR